MTKKVEKEKIMWYKSTIFSYNELERKECVF